EDGRECEFHSQFHASRGEVSLEDRFIGTGLDLSTKAADTLSLILGACRGSIPVSEKTCGLAQWIAGQARQ
ncbi:MAG: hypothetical protein AAGK33_15250, partial [Pseudomonadota bacterium]